MEPLGRVLGARRGLLGVSLALPEGSWGLLERSWELLEASWEALGSISEPSWEIFRAQKALGKHLGSDCLEL